MASQAETAKKRKRETISLGTMKTQLWLPGEKVREVRFRRRKTLITWISATMTSFRKKVALESVYPEESAKTSWKRVDQKETLKEKSGAPFNESSSFSLLWPTRR